MKRGDWMVSRKRISGRIFRAGKLLGSSLITLGWVLFMLNSVFCGNPGADAAKRLDRHVPITFGNHLLLAADSGYLFCHNSSKPSLNVYDDSGHFVCAYRIPNQGRGVSDLFSFQGDVLVEVYRGGGFYRYDSKGNYLGHWDSLDNAEAQIPTDGNYFIRWTTLYRPDGTVMDHSPLFMILWMHPFSAWMLMPLGLALQSLFKKQLVKISP